MHFVDLFQTDALICFGPGAHWKGMNDAKFGQMNLATAHACAKQMVKTISDYHEVLKEMNK